MTVRKESDEVIDEELPITDELEDEGDGVDDQLDAEPETETDEEAGDAEQVDEVPTISDELAQAAKDYDLDPSEFVSPQALERAIGKIDKKLSLLVRAPQPKEESKKVEASEEDIDDIDSLLSEDEYDPKVIKILKSIHGKNKMLESKLRQQESEAVDNAMDDFFDSLSEDYVSLFGKGGIGKLKENSTELKNRLELMTEIQALSAGDRQLNRPQQTLEQLAKRALRSRFGDEQEKLTRKEVAGKLSKRGNGLAVAKPSSKTSKRSTKDPYSRAVAYVEKFMESKG